MKTFSAVTVSLLLLALCSFVSLQSEWIVPKGSKANFTIDGLFGKDVDGTLDFSSSQIDFNPEDVASGKMHVVLDASTINTGIAKRDRHLKTADFFEVEKYKTITFQSTKIEQKEDSSYIVSGNLTIKDVTKPVEIPFTFSEEKGRWTFKGKLTINRMDYNVGKDFKKGVGDDVRINLDVPVEKN